MNLMVGIPTIYDDAGGMVFDIAILTLWISGEEIMGLRGNVFFFNTSFI